MTGSSSSMGLLAVGCCYQLLETTAPAADQDDGMEETVRSFPLSAAMARATAQSPSRGDAPLRLTRSMCAAAAESTNPAYDRRVKSSSAKGASVRLRRLARETLPC
jgi:hypothetical protein